MNWMYGVNAALEKERKKRGTITVTVCGAVTDIGQSASSSELEAVNEEMKKQDRIESTEAACHRGANNTSTPSVSGDNDTAMPHKAVGREADILTTDVPGESESAGAIAANLVEIHMPIPADSNVLKIIPASRWWPERWMQKTYERQSGATIGTRDTYWYTPHRGYKLRSTCEISKFLDFMSSYNGDESKAWSKLKGEKQKGCPEKRGASANTSVHGTTQDANVGLPSRNGLLLSIPPSTSHFGSTVTSSSSATNNDQTQRAFVSYPTVPATTVYPSQNDVLCSNYSSSVEHPGNVRFRQLVRHFCGSYYSATSSDKMKIVDRVIAEVRNSNPPGRFIEIDKNTGCWSDLGKRVDVSFILKICRVCSIILEPNSSLIVTARLQVRTALGLRLLGSLSSIYDIDTARARVSCIALHRLVRVASAALCPAYATQVLHRVTLPPLPFLIVRVPTAVLHPGTLIRTWRDVTF